MVGKWAACSAWPKVEKTVVRKVQTLADQTAAYWVALSVARKAEYLVAPMAGVRVEMTAVSMASMKAEPMVVLWECR